MAILATAPDNPAELMGISSTTEFKMKSSAKAFSILSSGLYENKIRAIIRELSCNAWDSHVAAGKKDVPFDVHLPTALSPYFSVRDYGIGLNHDEVTNIFTTYFESTKSSSNDFVGGLGLGSKSPFSYTDNFTVTSIKDGIKNVFSSFINNMGVPAIALLSSCESDEPTGVEIRFNVTKAEDYRNFKTEAVYVFETFDLLPNITGAQVKLATTQFNVVDIIPGVNQVRTSYYGRADYVVMGNVRYLVDIPESSRISKLKSVYDNGFYIYLNIGDVEFSASREGLSYTPATVDKLNSVYQQIDEALYRKIKDVLDPISNVWEKAEKTLEFTNGVWASHVGRYVNDNEAAYPLFATRNYYGKPDFFYQGFSFSAKRAADYNVAVKAFRTERNYRSDSDWANTVKEIPDDYVLASQPGRLKIVVNAENNPIYAKLKNHFRAEEIFSKFDVLMLSPLDPKLPFEVDRYLTEYLLSPPETLRFNADDIKVIPSKPKSRITQNNVLYLNSSPNDFDMIWHTVPNVDDINDDTRTYYYVPVVRHMTKFNEVEYDLKELYAAMLVFDQVKPIKQLYGVRVGGMEAVKSLPNWKPFTDLVIEIFKNLSAQDFYKMAVNEVDGTHTKLYSSVELVRPLSDDSDFKKFVMLTAGEQSKNMQKLIGLSKIFVPTLDLDTPAEEAKKAVRTIAKKYPMLSLLQNYIHDDSYSVVRDYITMIDNNAKESK